MRSCLPSVHWVTSLGSENSLPKALAPILTINTPKDVVSRKDVPSAGPENEILHFDPICSQNANFVPFFDDKISAQNGL